MRLSLALGRIDDRPYADQHAKAKKYTEWALNMR